MSVLNQIGEEQVECPLCMEPLEVDDLTFFPCTCGYQICRFCWHRIRTDENGLCPACRKAYPEDPADFKPLTQEEVAKLKAEKRQKDQQRKQKISENRKHLANVRVVQKNLVFVVGLPMRLADPETLKKHEYFGKFGKIHKVVINQSTSYAGSQGPSASAYVTYQKSDDALRAIQSVNNIVVDGRTVKTSLGTTKYCSHFMKNQPCPKADCMYLHELGDPEASFTKEEMQQGKHQEYEKKLHEQLLSTSLSRKPTPSPPTVPVQQTCKEAWPSLHPNHQNSSVIVGVAPSSSPPDSLTSLNNSFKPDHRKQNNFVKLKSRNCSEDNRKQKEVGSSSTNHIQESFGDLSSETNGMLHNSDISDNKSEVFNEVRKDGSVYLEHNGSDVIQNHPHEFMNHNGDNSYKDISEFPYCRNFNAGYRSRNGESSAHSPNVLRQNTQQTVTNWHLNGLSTQTSDPLPNPSSSENWQHTFNGYTSKSHNEDHHCIRDDDLGFDPFHETQKALAEMIEKEEQHGYQPKLRMHHNNRLNNCTKLLEGLRIGTTVPHSRPPPPGFTSTPNHMNAFGLGIPRTGSKILPFLHPTVAFPQHSPQPPAWDWPLLDPAIVTSAQHCDLYTTNPPPGFSTIRQTLDNL